MEIKKSIIADALLAIAIVAFTCGQFSQTGENAASEHVIGWIANIITFVAAICFTIAGGQEKKTPETQERCFSLSICLFAAAIINTVYFFWLT